MGADSADRAIGENHRRYPDYFRLSGKTFIGGHPAPAIAWTGSANGASTEPFIFLESDGGLVSLFGGPATLPIMSTDTARLAVFSSSNSNDIEWFFSNTYFSIRPDPALGLQAPAVHLASPTPDRHLLEEVWFRLRGPLPRSKDCDRLTFRSQRMVAKTFI